MTENSRFETVKVVNVEDWPLPADSATYAGINRILPESMLLVVEYWEDERFIHIQRRIQE